MTKPCRPPLTNTSFLEKLVNAQVSGLYTSLLFSDFSLHIPCKFEEDILDICFEILNKSLYFLKNPSKDHSQRSDVVYVCRVVSAMVRAKACPCLRTA